MTLLRSFVSVCWRICACERSADLTLLALVDPAPSAIGYAKKLLTHNFDSSEGFTLDGGIKDASHIRRLGASVDCPLPIVDVAHQHLIAARANAPAGKALDWSSLVAGQRMASGLPPFGKREGLQRDGGRRDE